MDENDKKEIPRSILPFLGFIAKAIWTQKKWWLIPVWIFLVALGLVILLSGGSTLLPAIYIAF